MNTDGKNYQWYRWQKILIPTHTNTKKYWCQQIPIPRNTNKALRVGLWGVCTQYCNKNIDGDKNKWHFALSNKACRAMIVNILYTRDSIRILVVVYVDGILSSPIRYGGVWLWRVCTQKIRWEYWLWYK